MPHPSFRNLIDMFRTQAARLGPRVALRHKRLGLYQDIAWADYEQRVESAACGWLSAGIDPADRVAILSENRWEWLVADLSILAAGAADVPLHAPLTAPQVAYQLADSGARWAVVSNAEQLAKVLEASARLPDLEGIAVFDPLPAGSAALGAFAAASTNAAPPSAPRFEGGVVAVKPAIHEGPRVVSWTSLLMHGRRARAHWKGELDRRRDQLGSDSLATIIYTSGTTGEPKGVMLTHGNLLANAQATCEALPPSEDGVLLSWLPYSHVYARLCDHYLSILGGTTVALAEGLESLVRNLAEVQPTHMTGVPRFYEKVWEQIARYPPPQRSGRLKQLFGARVRWLSSGGAPLPVEVAEGFRDCGIPLVEGYGLTESSPVIATNTVEQNHPGTVGRPIPGVELRIAPDGEVLTRGAHVMRGYWRKPDASAEAISPDGWLHTGDLGELDAEGYLRITGRKKDLIVTATGKNIAPQLIEALLTSDHLIDQAMVYGDRRKFLSALVVPNFAALAAEAQGMGIATADPAQLVQAPQVRRLFEDRIARRMAAVSSPERVKKFILLDRPFSTSHQELTATLKLRRQAIVAHYQKELDALYGEAHEEFGA